VVAVAVTGAIPVANQPILSALRYLVLPVDLEVAVAQVSATL
jgi:hypothetical protein